MSTVRPDRQRRFYNSPRRRKSHNFSNYSSFITNPLYKLFCPIVGKRRHPVPLSFFAKTADFHRAGAAVPLPWKPDYPHQIHRLPRQMEFIQRKAGGIPDGNGVRVCAETGAAGADNPYYQPPAARRKPYRRTSAILRPRADKAPAVSSSGANARLEPYGIEPRRQAGIRQQGVEGREAAAAAAGIMTARALFLLHPAAVIVTVKPEKPHERVCLN